MNLPNKMTIFRIVLIPVCITLLYIKLDLAAAVVFALACITDFLDGYIARKHDLVTNFGKFADPVADKLLVLTGMIVLCGRGLLPAWSVCIVAARELAVDGLRMVCAGNHKVLAAKWPGKIKTNLQFFTVLSAMLHFPAWLTLTLVILMSVMTVYSGVLYFYDNRDVFTEEKQA